MRIKFCDCLSPEGGVHCPKVHSQLAAASIVALMNRHRFIAGPMKRKWTCFYVCAMITPEGTLTTAALRLMVGPGF
jgi:hypothetical protein